MNTNIETVGFVKSSSCPWQDYNIASPTKSHLIWKVVQEQFLGGRPLLHLRIVVTKFNTYTFEQVCDRY